MKSLMEGKTFEDVHKNALFTRVGIVCVEEVDLLTSISIHVTGSNSNSVPCSVPQGIVWRAAVVNGDVYQPLLSAIVLQHQVGPVVPEGEHHTGLCLCSHRFIKEL